MKCTNCESTELSWFAHPIKSTEVQDGRLRASDVTTAFFLGCDECSETLKQVHPDIIAALLTQVQWRTEEGE